MILQTEGRVALIERKRAGQCYYLFPGGGVEEFESPEDAAVREALEELGVTVSIERMIATSNTDRRREYYFLAVIEGGVFGTGTGNELDSSQESQKGSYTPIWMDIARLTSHDVRPHSLAMFIADGGLESVSEIIDIRD